MRNHRALVFMILFLIPVICVAQEKGMITDSRDQTTYPWIRIGEQIWLTKNMAWLPSVNPANDARFEGSCYYVYGYNGYHIIEAKALENYQKYGVLYNWHAAQSACPEGWHLASDKEWQQLEKHLGMGDEANQREWREAGSVGFALLAGGSSGIEAQTAGCRGYNGFESVGFCGYFWTATPVGGDNAWRRGICKDDSGVCREEDRRYFGCSVRCLKD